MTGSTRHHCATALIPAPATPRGTPPAAAVNHVWRPARFGTRRSPLFLLGNASPPAERNRRNPHVGRGVSLIRDFGKRPWQIPL